MMDHIRSGMLSVAGICAISALCEQLMDRSRFFKVVRMALGMEIARILIGCVLSLGGAVQ